MFQKMLATLVTSDIYIFKRIFYALIFFFNNITHNNITHDLLNCSVTYLVVFECALIFNEVNYEIKLYKTLK